MKDLQLMDLYNPSNIKEIYVCRKNQLTGNRISAGEETAFQEYEKSIELWQKMKDGRLLRICRWLKKSVHSAVYADTETKDSVTFEPFRAYIKPKNNVIRYAETNESLIETYFNTTTV